jgi:hypothetical protein
MEFYKTTQTVRLSAGTILLLTVDQFNARQHLLAPKVDGLTVAKEPVEFKAGEIIGLDQVPLSLKTSLEEVEFEDGEFNVWLLTNFPDDELDDEPGDLIKPLVGDHLDKGDSDSLVQQGSDNLPADTDSNQSINLDLKVDLLSGHTEVKTLVDEPSDTADANESTQQTSEDSDSAEKPKTGKKAKA